MLAQNSTTFVQGYKRSIITVCLDNDQPQLLEPLGVRNEYSQSQHTQFYESSCYLQTGKRIFIIKKMAGILKQMMKFSITSYGEAVGRTQIALVVCFAENIKLESQYKEVILKIHIMGILQDSQPRLFTNVKVIKELKNKFLITDFRTDITDVTHELQLDPWLKCACTYPFTHSC